MFNVLCVKCDVYKNTVFPSKDNKWSIRIGMESAEEIRNAEIPKTGNP